MQILSHQRIARAKKSFATRRVPASEIRTLVTEDRAPRIGDLVLARVDSLGSHTKSELETGRKASLYRGDEVILAYGNRYAPDQYEAYVPGDLGRCHMVAAGGLAARAVGWHERLSGPTEIEPIGLLGGPGGTILNVAHYALPVISGPLPDAVLLVFGTSMNAGKTTLAASLVKGLNEAGHTVGAAKITGTGAGGDPWLMRDSGAALALDFTDAGFPSTFAVPVPKIMDGAANILRTLRAKGCTIAVVEIADGLGQHETALLARDPMLMSLATATFFAAGDAMGAGAGAAHLAELGHTVAAVSGSFTRSPMAITEAASIGVPVHTARELQDPAIASRFVSTPDMPVLQRAEGV